ncbi:MAG: hypothetical protein GX208_01775 [Firmicutes bacterium]|nr:hypothetical protein [Bacillota bacterium]
MEKYLNQGIKPLIEQFPVLGDILNKYDIGCTDCTGGSCLLKDVVAIHNVSPQIEADLMYEIEKAIYPERDVVKRVVTEQDLQEKKELKYSPPVKQLVDEHSLILRWLDLVEDVLAYIQVDSEQAWQWIAAGADFSRNYADKLHHSKEEDILFTYVDQSLEIIQVMYEDHDHGRSHIKQVYKAVENQDVELAEKHLLAYRALLREHIKKENEILFPWMDRNLTDTQVGQLFAQFAAVNAELQVDEKYRQFVLEVEDKLKKQVS